MADPANDTGPDDTPLTPLTPRERAADAAKRARERVSEATGSARDRASQAAGAARARGRQAVDRTSAGVVDNPLVAIAGGVIIGALIAGLLPRSLAEDRVAGNVGRKVRAQAKKTAKNVRNNAREQLDELGLNAESARKQLRGLADKIGQAAGDAASGSRAKK